MSGLLQLESINFLSAGIADKQRRAIGCDAAPGPKPIEIPAEPLQAKQFFRLVSAHLHPPI